MCSLNLRFWGVQSSQVESFFEHGFELADTETMLIRFCSFTGK